MGDNAKTKFAFLTSIFSSNNGSMLIVVILVLVLAAGAIFVYLRGPQIRTRQIANQAKQSTQSGKDELTDIDQSLSSLDTDLKSADAGINDKPSDISE